MGRDFAHRVIQLAQGPTQPVHEADVDLNERDSDPEAYINGDPGEAPALSQALY